jgi:hypothetical protein
MKTMKISALLIALSIFFANDVLGQKKHDKMPTNATYVSPTAKINKVYTKEELDQMGKLELTKIYMDRITVLTELSPYIALHTKPGATLEEMGIPSTPSNLDHLDKEVRNKDAYLRSVKDTLDDIIPYADKQNIIWAILFFDEMIKRIETGK